MNPDIFYPAVRRSVFNGSLTAGQFDGLKVLVAAWEASPFFDKRWFAQMLGTAHLETGHTMQPIKEYGGPDYHFRMYDINGERPAKARELGNIRPGDGALFPGRGYVQLTGRENYRKMGILLGQPLEQKPDLAMVPANAARIMFEGMTRGLFTGKSLADYLTPTASDWFNARRVVNGTDRAQEIADISRLFDAALSASATVH